MVFTSAEEAKPKKPHPKGLACLGCGATEASQWRAFSDTRALVKLDTLMQRSQAAWCADGGPEQR